MPLTERRYDWLFIIGFGCFALTSFLFDMQTAFDVDFSDPEANFLVRANGWFAHSVDPILVDPPLWLQIITGISAFIYGPFYLMLIYAFVKGDERIRMPAMLYVGAIEVTMIMMYGVELFGDERPLSYPLFFLAYTPYALLPAALAYRLRRPHPFAAISRR